MSVQGFTFFDTAIGRCGLAWSERGIAAVLLPEGREIDLWRQMLRLYPEAKEARPEGHARQAVDAIAAHLRGESADLDALPVDLSDIEPFALRVYEITRAIPSGTTRTYGEIAHELGSPGAARAVGRALGQNPVPIIIPCHRVLAANGGTGGFSGGSGVATKFQILKIEGAKATSAPTLFDVLFSIPPSRERNTN